MRSLAFTAAIALLAAAHRTTPQRGEGAHVGSINDALVAIEVTSAASDGATSQVRRGNGFVLRCDGFILAPTSLFPHSITVAGQREEVGKRGVVVVLHPGTDHEERFAGRGPRYTGKDLGYTVFKLPDFHSPALRTLLPDTVKPGSGVVLAFNRYDGPAHRWLPLERRTATTATAPAEGFPLGAVPMTPGQEDVTDGAVVLGPDGLAIGLASATQSPEGRAQVSRFTSFSELDRATNCVTPLPTPDSEAGLSGSAMVACGGGRMLASVTLTANQPDLEGAPYACVAPFQIDKYQVTNEEYLAYWNSLPDVDRKRLGFRSNYYPLTWAPWPNEPFPAELARRPVLGVPLPGAEGFAKAHGKRLPTPYEWQLAALGPAADAAPLPWAAQYMGERRAAFEKIKALHIDYYREHPELQQYNAILASPYQLPWIVQFTNMLPASEFSKRVVHDQLDQLWAMWKYPYYVQAIGSREYDASPCGAMDMIMNGHELVMPSPGPPALGNARYMEMEWLREKPPQRQPWGPRQIEAATGLRPLQPLSRLYRRNLMGPDVNQILLWENLSEAEYMLGPYTGWQLAMTGDALADATMIARLPTSYGPLGRPAGYQLWEKMPEYLRREMGRPVALNDPDPHGAPGPQLHYYLPTAFRCVR